MSWKENQTSLAHVVYMTKAHSLINLNYNSLHMFLLIGKFDGFHIAVMKCPLFIWTFETYISGVWINGVSPVSPKGNSWSEPSLTDYDESRVKDKKFTS